VRDDLPVSEARYRVRFYFDPNGISMAEGDRHLIFIGANLTGVVTQVEFGYSGGSYRLRAAAVNDGTTWTQSEWFAISDGPHAVEIDWRAATGAGANNGGLTLWIDGQQVAVLTGIDNDTRRIELGALGPVFGVNSGTRGSYYFDAFESRRQTYIGLMEGTPTATPLPTSTPTVASTATDTPLPTSTPTVDVVDVIFSDGFESGNLNAWSTAVTGGGDLHVHPSAALWGSQGLRAVINDNTAMGV